MRQARVVLGRKQDRIARVIHAVVVQVAVVDDDAQDDETDQQMNEMNPGEKEVVGKELAAVQAISRADQPDPLKHLEDKEHCGE